MLLNLTDYDSKKIELMIKGLEKVILETKVNIANLEYKKLRHELTLIEQGITEEDVEKHITDFIENSDDPESDIIELHKELNQMLDEFKENGNDERIEDLDKILHYSTIGITIINLQIEDYQEEIRVLNEQLLKLMDKQVAMQEKKVKKISTDRKYKELLNDE